MLNKRLILHCFFFAFAGEAISQKPIPVPNTRSFNLFNLTRTGIISTGDLGFDGYGTGIAINDSTFIIYNLSNGDVLPQFISGGRGILESGFKSGSGKGEFLNSFDLELSNDRKTLYLSDPKLSKIIQYRISNKGVVFEKEYILPSIVPSSIAVHNNTLFVLSDNYSANGYLHLFSSPSTLKKSFQTENSLEHRLPMVYFGHLAISKNHAVYVSEHWNRIIVYTSDGDPILMHSNVTNQPNPMRITAKKSIFGRSFYRENSIYFASNPKIVDNLLFVGYSGSEYYNLSFIDIYSLTNGAYLSSLNIVDDAGRKPSSFDILNDKLFIFVPRKHQSMDEQTEIRIFSIVYPNDHTPNFK
jgi:hypothetical protein